MASYAGSFLVARHSLRDPNFNRAVVLLLEHNQDGAFGVVVNRPAKAAAKDLPFEVYAGGPCESEGLLMLHGHAEWGQDAERDLREVAPGVFLGDVDSFTRLTEADPDQELRYRMFLGYSGWGPGQLEGELEGGAWVLRPADDDLVFGTPAEELWDRLAPPRLPEPSIN